MTESKTPKFEEVLGRIIASIVAIVLTLLFVGLCLAVGWKIFLMTH